MTPRLSISGLSRRFGGVQALSDVSMQVLPGEICSVIGPNGAGKTTLFNIISRLIREDAGQLLLDGQPLSGVRPHHMSARGVARTFQNLAVFKHRSVVENILVGMHSQLRTGMLGAAIADGRLCGPLDSWYPRGAARIFRARPAVRNLLVENLAADKFPDAVNLAHHVFIMAVAANVGRVARCIVRHFEPVDYALGRLAVDIDRLIRDEMPQ